MQIISFVHRKLHHLYIANYIICTWQITSFAHRKLQHLYIGNYIICTSQITLFVHRKLHHLYIANYILCTAQITSCTSQSQSNIILYFYSYSGALRAANLPALDQRREDLCRSYVVKIKEPSHRLNRLLPAPRQVFYPIRSAPTHAVPKTRTERFKNSLIPWCLRQ